LGGTVTQTWSKDSGPGTATFANANAVDTTATFSTSGVYVLKLTASDTAKTTSDTVTITVNGNTAPTVDAGSNANIPWPTDTVALDGTANDDGYPSTGSLTTTWSTDSGPGTVTFTDANATDTTATFSTLGVYVLKLTAEDGELTSTDTVTITVAEDLLMWLKLDEDSGTTAADSSGNDHYATTDAVWATGHLTGALEFDESSTEAIVGDFAIGTDFTLAFWFKPTDNDGIYDQHMFSWGLNGGYNALRVSIGEDDNVTYGGQLLTDMCDRNDTVKLTDLAVDDPNNYLDGDWHHYCLTVSSANGSRVYVDGTLEASKSTRGGDDMNPDSDIYLGAKQTLQSLYRYGGRMDDVRIYSSELDANEVADLASQ